MLATKIKRVTTAWPTVSEFLYVPHDFAVQHPDTKSDLQHSYQLMKSRDFVSFADL
jgi:hypothetical protein